MMTANDMAIRTEALTKSYRGVAALRDLTLAVPRGSVYGFLGPNGAGKTTTIRLLLGFIRASSGRAQIGGHDCWSDGVAARREIGYLVPSEALYPEMTGEALLAHGATLSGSAPVLRPAPVRRGRGNGCCLIEVRRRPLAGPGGGITCDPWPARC